MELPETHWNPKSDVYDEEGDENDGDEDDDEGEDHDVDPRRIEGSKRDGGSKVGNVLDKIRMPDTVYTLYLLTGGTKLKALKMDEPLTLVALFKCNKMLDTTLPKS